MRRLGVMLDALHRSWHDYHYEAAMALGLEELVVFTPDQVDWKLQRIDGYVRRQGEWVRAATAFPDIVYDIGSYNGIQYPYARKFKQSSGVEFVGDWLGNSKWVAQRHMMKSGMLRPHMIPTMKFDWSDAVFAMLDRYQTIIVKPDNTHGGTLVRRVSKREKGYALESNDSSDLHADQESLLMGLKNTFRNRTCIIQQWVDLRDREGRIYDIRVLMQKNGFGKWHLTGSGVRWANPGQITSNLETGADCQKTEAFLTGQFGSGKAAGLMEQLYQLSFHLAPHLEKSFGKRLVELGLDYAVDRTGSIWIIEANPKPGRQLIGRLYPKPVYRLSHQLPIHYAAFLLGSRGHQNRIQS